MKKILTCFLYICVFCFTYANDTTKPITPTPLPPLGVDTQTQRKANEALNAVQNLNNSFDSLKAINFADAYDSASYEFAKKNPLEAIYKNTVYLKCCNKKGIAIEDCKKSKWDQYGRFWLCIILIILLVYYALHLAKISNIIRDEAYDKDGNLIKDKLPFSYSRTQLLWWTVIIMCCYILLFGYTGVLAPLNGTCIMLLGMGVGVYGFARLIDSNQTKQLQPGLRHQETNPSKGFLIDILSDDVGISIHRFQALVFNIVFGVGFLFYFINHLRNCQYPFIEMEQWQLTLLGISSSAYLGLKATAENKKENAGVNNVSNNKPLK